DYDGDARVKQVASPEGTVNYDYDQTTGRHMRTWTNNSDIRYDYDDLGRLGHVTVVEQGGATLNPPLQVTYAYTATGQLASEVRPNGVRTDYTYDPVTDRLTDIVHKDAASTLLASYNYTNNALGQKTEVLETTREDNGTLSTEAINWVYDELGRL